MAVLLNILHFFDRHNGFFMFLTTLVLVVITRSYARQTERQADISLGMLKETEEAALELLEERHNRKLNYIYLINAEILMHRGYLANALYFLNKNNQNPLIKAIPGILQSAAKTTLKEIMPKHLKDETWRMVRADIAGLFPNELMQELAGYYLGVSYADLMTDPRVKNDMFSDYTRDQLISNYKVQEMLAKEAGVKLRTVITFDIEGKIFSFDPKTGNLNEISKSD